MFIKVTRVTKEGEKTRTLVNSDKILCLFDLTKVSLDNSKPYEKAGAKTVIILDALTTGAQEYRLYVTDTMDDIIKINE